MQCFTVCLSLLANATLRAFVMGQDHKNLLIACAQGPCDLVKQHTHVSCFLTFSLQVSTLLEFPTWQPHYEDNPALEYLLVKPGLCFPLRHQASALRALDPKSSCVFLYRTTGSTISSHQRAALRPSILVVSEAAIKLRS